MDQKKIGNFIKELRKKKGLTQERLAEQFGVSRRTVSRWETGSNLPDMSILIEMSDYFNVDLRELLDGERKDERMNQELKETVMKAVDYSNSEKEILMKKTHLFAWIGAIANTLLIILGIAGLADSGITENITNLCGGIAFGMLIVTVIYTGKYISKINHYKKKLFHRE